MSSFLDAETIKNFILKLVIPAADDDTPEQIRRVKLPRITDAQGHVSYGELVKLVLTFQPPVDNEEDAEDFENHDGQMSLASMSRSSSVLKKKSTIVILEYQDVDNDRVTIASTEELIDAIEQFQDKGLLRLVVTHRIVMAPAASSSLSRSMGAASGNHNDNVSVTRSVVTCTSTIHTNRSTPSNANGAGAVPARRTSSSSNSNSMVDTIVGALANVVVSLEKGMNAPYPPPKTTTTGVVPEPSNNKNAGQPEVEAAQELLPQDEEMEPEDTPKEERGTTSLPFIHGRHTCDSCLVSPIIGNRYHATNLPDYDVCQVCFDNYQGTEIQFEILQQERDVPFQERWNRRKERVESKMMRHRHGRCGGGRGRWGRRGGGRGGGRRFGRWNLGPQVHDATPTPPQDFDRALTEAIRRSLEDVGPTNKEVEEEKMAVVNVVATTTSSNPPTAPMEEEIVVPATAPTVDQLVAPTIPVALSGKVRQSNLKPLPAVETLPRNEVDKEGTNSLAPVQSPDVSRNEDALDMVVDVIDEMMQDAYAKFQTAELNAQTVVKDNSYKGDGSVASNSSASNEWQLLVDNEDENSTMIHQIIATVTEEQRQRWFAQLSQLREIGFHDEGKCVETLERLHAANIGSDMSDEEVSVARVVNEMLNQNK